MYNYKVCSEQSQAKQNKESLYSSFPLRPGSVRLSRLRRKSLAGLSTFYYSQLECWGVGDLGVPFHCAGDPEEPSASAAAAPITDKSINKLKMNR